MYAQFFLKSLLLALTHRFEAVHAGRALPEGLVAWLVARLTFHRVAIYAHGEELTSWGAGGKYKAMCFALRHADTVIANSDNTREELLRMGVSSELIVLINPGVDVARFRHDLPYVDLREKIGLAPDEKLILSVGRLSRRKGFDMIIRTLPLLSAQGLNVRYALIGIGEDHDYLQSLAQELGVSDRVFLLGHVEPDDLPRWYNACDVFVMPTIYEPFGLVFGEAMACGLPVVVSRKAGAQDWITHGENGFVVTATDVNEITEAIKAALANPTIGMRGRATVIAHNKIDVSDQYAALYQQLMSA